MAVLDQIGLIVQPVDEALYRDFGQLARERMVARDVADWPIVAVALMLSIPVWTEDRDLFGSGMPLGRLIGSSCTCRAAISSRVYPARIRPPMRYAKNRSATL